MIRTCVSSPPPPKKPIVVMLAASTAATVCLYQASKEKEHPMLSRACDLL